MKKLFIIVVYMFMSFTVHAQITAPFPQNLQKKSAIDTARYKVTYNLKYIIIIDICCLLVLIL